MLSLLAIHGSGFRLSNSRGCAPAQVIETVSSKAAGVAACGSENVPAGGSRFQKNTVPTVGRARGERQPTASRAEVSFKHCSERTGRLLSLFGLRTPRIRARSRKDFSSELGRGLYELFRPIMGRVMVLNRPFARCREWPSAPAHSVRLRPRREALPVRSPAGRLRRAATRARRAPRPGGRDAGPR